MRLNIKATNITLNDEIRDYLEKRLLSLDKLINLEDPSVMTDVELGRTTLHHEKGFIFRAEINISKGKSHFRAEAECEDLNTAIDVMRDEISRELVSEKGKKASLFRRGGKAAKDLLKFGYQEFDEWIAGPTKKGMNKLKSIKFWDRS